MNDVKIGLILSGGGARAAYQVGVLAAVAELIHKDAPTPFKVISGTSAGAINAAALAAGARHFRSSISHLIRIWKNLHVERVYYADLLRVLGTGTRWLSAMFFSSFIKNIPVSLLDNSPLAELLAENIPFEYIQKNIEHGDLHAVTVTAFNYSLGCSVAFCQGAPGIETWQRAQRIGVHSTIALPHLMASSAIPFIFPPVKIDGEFYGDGAMRQIAPLAPVLHLDADRIMVIGVSRSSTPQNGNKVEQEHPSMAQIGGHTLAGIFLDSLGTDLEKVRLVNTAVRLIPPERLPTSSVPLRDVELLIINPSEPLESLALRYVESLPKTIKIMLGGIGGTRRAGSHLLSYLLFEKQYCWALISLGFRDAMKRKDDIQHFLAPPTQSHRARFTV